MIKILVAVVAVLVVAGFIISTQMKDGTAENTSPVVTGSEDRSDAFPDTNEIDESAIASSGVLDLSGQSLSEIPSYVFSRINIQKLDLSNNNFDGSLQAEVRLLQNLKILDLSNNQFTGVPAEIGQLKNLETLDLSNNQITGLPHELGNLSNLRVLNLQGNDYSETDLEIIRKGLPSTTAIITD